MASAARSSERNEYRSFAYGEDHPSKMDKESKALSGSEALKQLEAILEDLRDQAPVVKGGYADSVSKDTVTNQSDASYMERLIELVRSTYEITKANYLEWDKNFYNESTDVSRLAPEDLGGRVVVWTIDPASRVKIIFRYFVKNDKEEERQEICVLSQRFKRADVVVGSRGGKLNMENIRTHFDRNFQDLQLLFEGKPLTKTLSHSDGSKNVMTFRLPPREEGIGRLKDLRI
jgi:hypothetical protein